jgi:DNA-binding SARP family transcriptional activator
VACKPATAQVEVFGPLRVRVAGQDVSFGRADGRALFALLATYKDGESSESLIERLWPRDEERGLRRLETAIRDINGAMRKATGLGAEVKFVVKAEQRRSLPPVHFDVDWWRFEQAYVKANTADSDSGRREALRQMLDLYQGPYLAGRDDLWCLPLRQAALNQVLTAVTQLAELERKQDPERALGTLTLAVSRIDPHSEVLWCQIMTIQGELGRFPVVEWTFQQLTERLAEIDAKPGPQARRTYERFIK